MSHAARHRQYPPLNDGRPPGPPRAAAPGSAGAGAPPQGPPRAPAAGPPTARTTATAPTRTTAAPRPVAAVPAAAPVLPTASAAKPAARPSGGKTTKARRTRYESPPQRRAGRSLLRHLLRVGILYTLYSALWSCPSTPFSFDYNPADSRSVCRTLTSAGEVLGPHLGPYAQALDERAAPYVSVVAPYAQAGYRVAAPALQAVQKAGSQLYHRHVVPVQERTTSAVTSWAAPHVSKAHAAVHPHVKVLTTELGHYNDMYWRDVHPYVATVHGKVDAGARAGGRAYLTHAHPRVVQVLQSLYTLIVDRFFPMVARTYATYVLPHLRTLGTKVWESKSALRTREAIASTHLDALGPVLSRWYAQVSDKAAAWAQPRSQEPDPAFIESLTTQIRAQLLGEQAEELARKEAARKEEESMTYDRLNLWEVGLTEHIKKSYKTWTERIITLRDSTIADLPVRFATLTGDFVDSEAGAAIARLERRFEALSPAKDPRPVEERVEIAQRGLKREQNKLLAEGAQLRKELQAVLTELDEAEKASTIKSADDLTQFVEAAVSFQQRLMEQAQYPETVTRFGRWDMGMHMRAKLYRAEIEDVLYRGKPVKADMDVQDPNRVAPDVARHVADLQQRTALLYSAAAEAIRRYGADATEELRRTPREVLAADEGVKRHNLALIALKRVAEAATEMQTQIPKALLDAAAAAREKLGWEEIVPENPDEDLYNGPPPEIDTITRTDAIEEATKELEQHEAEQVDLSSLEEPDSTIVPVEGHPEDQVVFHAATTSVAQPLATASSTSTPTPTEEEQTFHVGTTSVAQPVGTEDAALSASFASQEAAAATTPVLVASEPTSEAEPPAPKTEESRATVASEEPVATDSTSEPVATNSTSEPVANEPTAEPVADESVEPPVAEPTEEPSVPGATATAVPKVEPEVEEVLTSPPAALLSVQEAHEATATTSPEFAETPTATAPVHEDL